MEIRHSILIITYKQEKLIGACLDSVLSQSVSPYEIVVVDDCSPDGTWAVIQSYVAKSSKIRAFRNERNLGVFGNFNKGIKLLKGDFINVVAGDDLLPVDILRKYDAFIKQNNLDCNVPFVIYTNSMSLKPDGTVAFWDNSANFQQNMSETCCLHCFHSWDTGISSGLWQQLSGIREDIGYQADFLWHFEKTIKAKYNYFLNEVGYIYRENVGVTVTTSIDKHLKSKRQVVSELSMLYSDKLSKKAKDYLILDNLYMTYQVYPTWKNYFSFLKYYILFRYNYSFPVNNVFYQNYRILLPITIKKIVKRIIVRN